MRERFVSELVYICRGGLMVKSPVCETGDLRFKSQLRHKFFPTKTLYAFLDSYISPKCPAHLSRLDLRFLIMQSRIYSIKNHQILTINTEILNSVDVLVSEILILKLILICKFQSVPYALDFEVKHSKFSVEHVAYNNQIRKVSINNKYFIENFIYRCSYS